MNTTNQHTPAPVEDPKTASILTDPYFLQALEESMAQKTTGASKGRVVNFTSVTGTTECQSWAK